MTMMLVALNERGYRVGLSHHNAHIPDEVIDAIRDLHEDAGLGYRKLARQFSLSRSTVQKICNYDRRAQTPDRWKRMPDTK